ncbi:glycosyltransferase [Pseudoalteromonas fenneropenaei]|uniref:Glycosyltransferase n=1 Tax=Pseudoalteromonas fenneropenaei TaxID=1737459 RepID=A0ABV7CK67_9GAMM
MTSKAAETTSPHVLVSCVMPTCRRAHYLEQSLRYFLRQDYPHKELILVYESESDLPAHFQPPVTVRLCKVPPQTSIGLKRSIGTAMANGHIIAQWDDDDWYSNQRLSIQVEPILNGLADITGLANHGFYDVWRDQFWRVEPELYATMFRRSMAGGTLVFTKRFWRQFSLDYCDSSLREDADFMDEMIGAGARLQVLDGEQHFVYLRHLQNTWSFISGKLIRASAWLKDTKPTWFVADNAFYQQLRNEHFASFLDSQLPCQVVSAQVTCIALVEQQSHVQHLFQQLQKQTQLPNQLIVVHLAGINIAPLCALPFEVVNLEVNTLPESMFAPNLLELVACPYVMCWPTRQAWVSEHWLRLQMEFLFRHNLDATGISQPFLFFPKKREFWQYIASDSQLHAWFHPESVCCTVQYWRERCIQQPQQSRAVPHHHLEHFLAFAAADTNSPSTEQDPKWFPYQPNAVKEMYKTLNLSSILQLSASLSSVLLCFALMLNSPMSYAQEKAAELEEQAYSQAFFQQFNPQHALDMIYRIPGFSFEDSESARGFGGNVGNVLVNSARPVAKSEDLSTLLARISVSQIKEIKIYRGSKIPLEAAGKEVVADIILLAEQQAGTILSELKRFHDASVRPKLEVQFTTQLAEWQTSTNLDVGASPGYRTAQISHFDQAAELSSEVNEVLDEDNRWLYFSGQFEKKSSHQSLALRARVGGEKYSGDTNRHLARQVKSSESDFLARNLEVVNRSKTAELGVDWSQQFDSFTWQNLAIFVVTDKSYHNDDSEHRVTASQPLTSLWQQDELKTESIVRSTLEFRHSPKLTQKVGIEVAQNRMLSDLNLTYQDITATPEHVEVSEIRTELFSNFAYQYSQDVTFEGGLTAEYSTLSVAGEQDNEETLFFIKPRLAGNWSLAEHKSVNLALTHHVGQLDFSDFARSARPEDGSSNVGNSKLQPEQTTELVATYNWQFAERSNFKLKLFHEWRQDVLEQVAFSARESGLANAGDARFFGFSTELKVALEPLLANAVFEISYDYKDSQFDNPNQRTEHLSSYIPNWVWMNFRHDFPQYRSSWGVEYWGDYREPQYFAHETLTVEANKRLKAFIETSLFWDVKIQFEVTHLNTARFIRSRDFYYDEQFQGSEISRQISKPEFKLALWKTF